MTQAGSSRSPQSSGGLNKLRNLNARINDGSGETSPVGGERSEDCFPWVISICLTSLTKPNVAMSKSKLRNKGRKDKLGMGVNHTDLLKQMFVCVLHMCSQVYTHRCASPVAARVSP